MSEISIGMTASEGAVLTVLTDLKNGKIDDAIACFGERRFADRVRKWFFAMPCGRRGPMTFDELWRVNLDQERARGDSAEKAEAGGLLAVPGENANELLLTAEDLCFCWRW